MDWLIRLISSLFSQNKTAAIENVENLFEKEMEKDATPVEQPPSDGKGEDQ